MSSAQIMKEHRINRDISAVSTNMKLNKILVVRNDNIGDVVCTTPCFEALKETFPHARLGVLVNRIAEVNGQVHLGETPNLGFQTADNCPHGPDDAAKGNDVAPEHGDFFNLAASPV